MQRNRLLPFLLCLFIFVQVDGQENERDSISLSDAVTSFLGLHQPKPGFMGQFALEVSEAASNTRTEFTLRNIRVYISGKSGDKFSYYFQGSIYGEYKLLDLRMSYILNRNFRIDMGRLKAPFGSEFLKNDAKLLFLTRSMAALNIGPLRQYGVQLNTVLFDKRIEITSGIFNGGGDQPPKISLLVGKINTIPITEIISDSPLQIALGGSAAFTRSKADFPDYIYIDKYHLLYGAHARITYGSYWLEGEYNTASSDNKKTIEGFACDIGRRFGTKWETAVRFDWMERYSVLYSTFMDAEILRKYLVGVNWYPLSDIKIQLNLERYESSNIYHAAYINLQYAINYE